LIHWCMSELPRWIEHFQRSKVMEIISSKFYWLHETMVNLYRACLGMTNLVWWATEWRRGELVTGVKSTVVVCARIVPRDGEIQKHNGYEIHYGQDECMKKKFKGFPTFLTFENFKKSLFGRHEAVVESALASSSSLLSSSSKPV
jgi:hypothetical protein